MSKRIVSRVNPWLSVGNKLACGSVAANLCLHINRSDRPDKDCCRSTAYGKSFEIDYQDGQLLSDAALRTLDDLIADLRTTRNQTCLVHCNAGGCRSPLLAAYVWAMADVDVPFMEALTQVVLSIHSQQHKLCNIVYQPTHQLLNRWEVAHGLPLTEY